MKLETNGCPQNICNYCVASDSPCIGTETCLVYGEIQNGTPEGKLFKSLVLGDE